MINKPLGALALTALFYQCAASQPAQPTFEVASVKQGNSRETPVAASCKNDRFLVRSMPLNSIMFYAFDLRAYQFAEFEHKAPSWVRGINYTIEAKASAVVSESQCRVMLQTLLAERFALRYHWEERPGMAYILTIAPGGHKLRPIGKPIVKDEPPVISIVVDGKLMASSPFASQGRTIEDIARSYLTPFLNNNPVDDHTGLEGRFGFSLRFSSGYGTASDFPDPELIAAVRQQMGLKLENKSAQLKYFEIDNIGRPDVN